MSEPLATAGSDPGGRRTSRWSASLIALVGLLCGAIATTLIANDERREARTEQDAARAHFDELTTELERRESEERGLRALVRQSQADVELVRAFAVEHAGEASVLATVARLLHEADGRVAVVAEQLVAAHEAGDRARYQQLRSELRSAHRVHGSSYLELYEAYQAFLRVTVELCTIDQGGSDAC